MMSNSDQIPSIEARAIGSGVSSATIKIWQPFATQHLWTALHMARLCDERETELLGQGETGPDIEHKALATTAVISAACFVESYVNEIYAVAADDNRALRAQMDGVDNRAAELLGLVWKGTDMAADKWALLDKYQFALAVAGKPKMNPGTNPCQNMKRLLRLRNALVHFKPEWQAHDVAHKVEADLKGIFPGNRLYGGAPWFPQVCLAYGCAEWACDTSISFVDTWCGEMGIKLRPQDSMDGWPRKP
ncbi:hypothetical protein ACIO14_27560 [Nocardia fluminea]|uniref:hypothetical protein n=1 Tax=Nocardia fluminea TaxID=134984 RepID=UPI00380DE568